MAVLVILLAIGLISLAGFTSRAFLEKNLFRPYWFLPKRQYWTCLSSGFLHADLPHLLFNGLTYWFFAPLLQRAIGEGRFAALYFLGLVLSNLGTWIKHRRQPEYATLGASGAITAVLFAAIVYFPNRSIAMLLIPVPIPAPLFAVLYLGFTFYAARRGGGRINHDAHLDGALTGLAFVAVTDPAAWARAWHLVMD
jgi:membrane associated rhomboid family serine protease